MPLANGTRLGHYEITTLIGRGGMGEVYRARDTQLKRDVALKVLPAVFSTDADRLARFQREAEVLASLDHPNIAPIFGLVEADGVRALALALVEGPTLADRIAAGLPLDEAPGVVRQIIDALEYAHDRGVIHRDLKPANIKVTPEGAVKVLDFGLAKVLDDAEPSPPTGADSPTLTLGHTRAGMILGTAAYMSPEQAVGKPADRRSDIFSFGAVLFEMLTGERAFKGDSVPETLVAVAKDEPDWSKLPATLPRACEKLLRRCLVKDRRQRLQAIGEGRILLEAPVEPTSAIPLAGSEVVGRASRPAAGLQTRLPWAVAVALALALAVFAFLHFRETPPEARLMRTTILPPDKTTFSFGASRGPMALSPDGKRMVFAATDENGKSQLWVRPLDSITAQPLQDTEGAQFPFWSPDSRFVAFFAGGKLKKIDTAGGPSLTLADAPNARGGSWSNGAGPEGVIVFAPLNDGPLQRVSSAGGTPAPASAPSSSEGTNYRFPWFLPDGKHFLFESNKRIGGVSTRVSIHVASLGSLESKIVAGADSNAVYSDGHLLYLRANTLVAQPFDLKTLSTTGEAAPVAEHVDHVMNPGTLGYSSVSATGLLAFQTGAGINGFQLTWFDRAGKAGAKIDVPQPFNSLGLSPDRRTLAASRTDGTGNMDIWTYDVARGLPTRFTFDPSEESYFVWSPDGRTIIFDSSRKGRRDLYRKPANGSGAEELLYADDFDKRPTSWSPDGKFLLYYTQGNTDIWVLPLTPDKPGAPLKPIPFVKTPFNESHAQFSPDGRWVVYQSNESQRLEVYVAPFPGPGGKRQISQAGGVRPRWRQDGKEIFYVSLDNQLMAAEVSVNGTAMEVGAVRPLFGPIGTVNGYFYDVSADGQHILAAVSGEQKSGDPITLVQNWALALRK